MTEPKLRIGLDIHGVIDAKPFFFSQFSHRLIENGHEVYIITGAKISEGLIRKLRNLGMVWTGLYSITNYNEDKGASIRYEDPDNPWMDEKTWDSTKARICDELKIDIHIDDTARYGEWFKTLRIPTIYVLVHKASD